MKINLENGIHKFVKLDTGQYIFRNMEKTTIDHKNMVPKEHKALAAGIIACYNGNISVSSRISYSLNNLGFGEKEELEIEELTGMKFVIR